MWYLWYIYIIPTPSKAAAKHSSDGGVGAAATLSLSIPYQVIVFAFINFYFFRPVIYGAVIWRLLRAIYRYRAEEHFKKLGPVTIY